MIKFNNKYLTIAAVLFILYAVYNNYKGNMYTSKKVPVPGANAKYTLDVKEEELKRGNLPFWKEWMIKWAAPDLLKKPEQKGNDKPVEQPQVPPPQKVAEDNSKDKQEAGKPK